MISPFRTTLAPSFSAQSKVRFGNTQNVSAKEAVLLKVEQYLLPQFQGRFNLVRTQEVSMSGGVFAHNIELAAIDKAARQEIEDSLKQMPGIKFVEVETKEEDLGFVVLPSVKYWSFELDGVEFGVGSK